MNRHGGGELRDLPCAGFYFVCMVGGKFFCWTSEGGWLDGFSIELKILIVAMESRKGS